MNLGIKLTNGANDEFFFGLLILLLDPFIIFSG
jgi:hypothetical protein